MGWRERPSGLLVPDDVELPDEQDELRGVCEACGCTETEPCVIEASDDPTGVDDTFCGWTDYTRTLCTGCV